MSRRIPQTLADYVIVAISPALIMTLIGSLIFFLLEVFYQGEYSGRLKFIFAMFVMATVLIGRIAIAEGTSYAALFGMPLAVVSALAMARFVRIDGPLSGIGWLVNWSLLALVWWCAHKLTWDCTLIDDSQDASGEGLLQTVGLESSADGEDPTAVETAGETIDEPEATTVRYSQPQTWWQRWLDRRRPHAPGVWVVYFSLAALPLFGIGQWFIPASNLDSRRYAFWLLCVYVASGLGLLVTTSFLGLRRYLRQRHLQMPSQMAATWLGLGAALVVGLLFVAWWLPRPSPEYSLTQIPFTFSSPDIDPSRYGFGNDGPQEDEADRSVPAEANEKPESQTSVQTEESGDQGAASQSAVGDQQSPQPPSDQTGSKQIENDQPAENRNGDSQPAEAQSQGEQATGGQPTDGRNADTSDTGSSHLENRQSKDNESINGQSKNQQAQSAGARSPRDDPSAKAERAPDSSAPSKTAQAKPSPTTQSRDGSAASAPPPRPPINPQAVLQSAFAWAATLIKWVFYLVLAGIIAYLVWRNWAEVRAGLLRLREQIRDLWQKLFGGGPRVVEVEAAQETLQQPQRRSFADFADPFASGRVPRQTPNQLVKYSFEALEAWARDRGYPRPPEQTPHEFAAQIAVHDAELADRAQSLADLYCRVAYAQEVLPTAAVDQLRPLWQRFREPLATAGNTGAA